MTQISISFNDYCEIVLIERKVKALTAQLQISFQPRENQENNFLRRADESNNVNVLDNSLQSLGGVEPDQT